MDSITRANLDNLRSEDRALQNKAFFDVLDGLTTRFHECSTEKNCTLIRYDIIQSLRNVYDAVKDEAVRETALALIEIEADTKYRKKYAGVWRVK